MSENRTPAADMQMSRLVTLNGDGCGGYSGVILWNGIYIEFGGKGFQPIDNDSTYVKRPRAPFKAEKLAKLRRKYSERRLIDRVDRCTVIVTEKLDELADGEELNAGAAWEYVLEKMGLQNCPPTDYNYFLLLKDFATVWQNVLPTLHS